LFGALHLSDILSAADSPICYRKANPFDSDLGQYQFPQVYRDHAPCPAAVYRTKTIHGDNSACSGSRIVFLGKAVYRDNSAGAFSWVFLLGSAFGWQ
jgi:hypothetical protein